MQLAEQVWVTRSEEETIQLGERLGRALSAPAVLLLKGELGAGKTALTRGLARGLGLEDATQVHSPTFSLVNIYRLPGSRTLVHIDLYRLETPRDFHSIDLDELLDPDPGEIVVVEWAEKIPWPVPTGIEIEIAVGGEEEERRFTVRGGPAATEKLGSPS
ncbi:MAG: hypothetical protein Kow00109_17520 [Acidobacteriota bacterium]